MSSVTFLPSSSVTFSTPSFLQHLAYPVIVSSAPAAVIIIAIIAVIAVTVSSVTFLVTATSKGGGEETGKETKEWSRGGVHKYKEEYNKDKECLKTGEVLDIVKTAVYIISFS